MPAPRHLKWPLQLDAKGPLATNEQDTDADIETAIAVILSYPIGARLDAPKFGIPDEGVKVGGPDLDVIRQAVTSNEPRADVQTHLADDRLLGGLALVRLGYTPKESR